MKTLTKKLVVSAALSSLVLAGMAMAQGRMKSKPNAQSPIEKTQVTLGGQTITVDYNAPSMRGRKIFGGQVVPYDQVWRTGADAATTLTTSADLTIGTLKVPKGVYSLYSMPGASEWQLVVSKQVGQWGTEYDQGQDLGRVPMTVTPLSSPLEKMQIELVKKGGKSGELHVRWENTDASVPVKVD